MKICRIFIPKGNGVARNYRTGINSRNAANYAALLTAGAGIGALLAKEPNAACLLTSLSLTGTAIAKHFAKKTKMLSDQFFDIISRRAHIDAAAELKGTKNIIA